MRNRLSTKAGLAVRRLRLSHGMTLAELSERSGVPLSSLSKLELGQLTLTYDKLMRLSRVFGSDFEDIIQHEATTTAPRGRRSLAREGAGASSRLGPHRAVAPASELLSKAFTPLVLDVKVHSLKEHGPLVQLGGEAYLMTLEGEAILHMESYAPLVLKRGDSLYFDGRSPHAILSGGGRAARVLFVASPEDPVFG